MKTHEKKKNAAVCSCRHSKTAAIVRGVYGVWQRWQYAEK